MGRPGLTDTKRSNAVLAIEGWFSGEGLPAAWPAVGPVLAIYVDRVSGKGAGASQKQIGDGPTIPPATITTMGESAEDILQEVLDSHGSTPCTLSLRSVFLADPADTRENWHGWPGSDGSSPSVHGVPLRHRIQLTRGAVERTKTGASGSGGDRAASDLGAQMADIVGLLGRRLDSQTMRIEQGTAQTVATALAQSEQRHAESLAFTARIMELKIDNTRLEDQLDRAEDAKTSFWEHIPPEAWGPDGVITQTLGGALPLLFTIGQSAIKLLSAKADLAAVELALATGPEPEPEPDSMPETPATEPATEPVKPAPKKRSPRKKPPAK